MARYNNNNHDDEFQVDSGDDSDIQEITIIGPPRSGDITDHSSTSSNFPKRRKSSPQMDPIPIYTPTPIHILEQRARDVATNRPTSSSNESDFSMPNYAPTIPNSDYSPITSNNYSTSQWDQSLSDVTSSIYSPSDYVPLLEPSPSVVGRTTVESRPRTRSKQQTPTSTRSTSSNNSASALRPFASSALSQAIARRRGSQTERPAPLDHTSAAQAAAALFNVSTPSIETKNCEEPVMWSPHLPSQIPNPKIDNLQAGEELGQFSLPRATKQRIAHKPTVPRNKGKRPKVPIGVARKVPAALRIKYLDVIIDEYLNTGHTEEESYKEALEEEKALADRAANRNIYINLVAGLKKKIREKKGISTLPQDDDPKFVNGNKVVSHDEIITGKVIGTFSIEKKRKTSDPSELNEYELYDRLMRYVVPIEQLELYGYPVPDPDETGLRKVPLGKDGQKQQLRAQLAASYTCERCTKSYRVDPDGMPLEMTGKCIYHPGHLWNERINRNLEKRYSCCKGDPSAGGCSSNPYHVHKGELELSNYKGYVATMPKPDKDPNKHGLYALDCEMCYTTHGLELTRVTVINHKQDVVYEKLVKPLNPILDYNTKFSGIRDGDLKDVTTSLADVQQDFLNMFSTKTILIGHSLDSDMKALKLFHQRFIDTAQLFPHKRGLPFKRALRTLMVENLRVIIQDDVGHDSKEDASAAFRLVLWKAKTDVPMKVS